MLSAEAWKRLAEVSNQMPRTLSSIYTSVAFFVTCLYTRYGLIWDDAELVFEALVAFARNTSVFNNEIILFS